MRASKPPVNERLRAVREATGLTQLQFLPLLNRKAAAVGRSYSQSTLSKLESGAQEATLEDIAAFAAADPLERGKLWLGWGDDEPLATNVPLVPAAVEALRLGRAAKRAAEPGDRQRPKRRPGPQ